MDFFICAQDIGFMSLGLVDGRGELVEETVSIAPEHYLQTIDLFLKKQKVSIDSIKRMLIVPGPGSFTASRVSVTIANTIAFANQIPVVSIPNPQKQSLTDLLASSKIDSTQEFPFALPIYDRPPMITPPKSQVV